jgi:hypothetical protein
MQTLEYPRVNQYSLLTAVTELEKSQQLAQNLELQVSEAERQRRELEEAQRRAEEARRMAEEAAYLEKAEREMKVGDLLVQNVALCKDAERPSCTNAG